MVSSHTSHPPSPHSALPDPTHPLTSYKNSTPVHYYWSRSRGGTGHCVDGDTVLIGLGIVNCITDALIVTLPLPLLWRLRTTRAQKALLTGIFVTTGFVCVISVIRLVVLSRLTVYDLSCESCSFLLFKAPVALLCPTVQLPNIIVLEIGDIHAFATRSRVHKSHPNRI